MNPLALALAGRREDNAAHGGQVAHISAAEAELLKSMGGAGSINPITGLPEYIGTGSGVAGGLGGAMGMPGIGIAVPGSLGLDTATTAAQRGAMAAMSSAMGGYGGHGLGTSPAQYGGPRGNVTAITTPAESAANAIAEGMSSTMYGLEGPGGILGFTPSPSPGLGSGATPPSNVPANIANVVSVNPTMYGLEGPGGIGPSGTGSTATTPTPTVQEALIEHFRPPEEGDSLGKVLAFLLGWLPGPLAIPNAIAAFAADAAGGNMGGPPPPGVTPGSPTGTFGGFSTGNPNTGTGHPMGLTYGGYSPPTTSGINRLLQSVTPAPIEPEPVVSAAPVAPVTTLLQTDPIEEGFSPSIQEIRRIFFESLA